MAITYQAIAGATSGTITIPTGTANDVAVVMCENGAAPADITMSAGWIAMHPLYAPGSLASSVRVRMFYKIFTGTSGEVATITGGDVRSGLRITGADATNPLAWMASPIGNGSGTAGEIQPIRIRAGNDHLIGVCSDTTGSTSTAPTGSTPTYTEITDVNGQAWYKGTYSSEEITGSRVAAGGTFVYSLEVILSGNSTTPTLPTKAGDLGTQVSDSAATTTVVSYTGTPKPAVGDLVVMYGSRDNITNDPATGDSFSDGEGNTYTRVAEANPAGSSTANAGIVGVFFYSVITSAWTGTNTLTWTHDSTKAAMRMEWWTGISALRASGTASAGSTAGAPSVALTTPVAEDLVLAMEAIEHSTASTSTGDADTTNGVWSRYLGPVVTTGTTLAAVKVISQYKMVTTTGTQTYNPTHSVTTNTNCVAIIAAFVKVTSGSTINGTISDAFTFSAPASGGPDRAGTISDAFTFAAPAVGTPNHPGTIATNIAFAGTATGTVSRPLATLADTFDTAINTPPWTDGTDTAVASGRLRLSHRSDYTSAITATGPYTLRESSIYVKVEPDLLAATAETEMAIISRTDPTDKIRVVKSGGDFFMYTQTNGTPVNGVGPITFSATNHLWWRVRETGGQWFADTSADGTSWTNRYTGTTATDITWDISNVEVTLVAGYFGTETTPFYSYFDNVNTVPAATVNGTADATFTVSNTATGVVDHPGQITTNITFDAPAVGTRTVTGVAVANLLYSSDSTGTRAVSGTADATFAVTNTAVGTNTVGGTAATTLTFAADAVGTVSGVTNGTAAADLTFAADAVGTKTVSGTADATLVFDAAALGQQVESGTADATFTLTAPATGTRTVFGSTADTFIFDGPATGTRTVLGTAVTTLTFDAPATGTPTVTGTAAANLTFAATADGTSFAAGAGVATTDLVFAAPAVGTRTVFGVASDALTFTTDATGTRTVFGSTTTDIVFVGTAGGTQVVSGSTSDTFTFASPVVGTRVVSGTADATVTFDAPATGIHIVPGVATTDLTFTAPAVGSVTVSGVAEASFLFVGPAAGGRVLSGTASSTFTFAAPAEGIVGFRQFFPYADFLEYVRAQVETGTGRPCYLSDVTEGHVPVEPYSLVHAFGSTGALVRAWDGQAVTISFYLQVDGIGRKYHDAIWVLDKAIHTIRRLPCPDYVNDMLVVARSSTFEIDSEALRGVGRRMGVTVTRPD